MTSTNGWRRSKFCDTGGCLEIAVDGQSVSLRETSTPDQVVVTSLASWETWRAEAKAEERAAIVTWLRSRAKTLCHSVPLDDFRSFGYAGGLFDAAHLIESRDFDDLAAGDE